MGELKTSVEVHELCASDQNSVRMRRLPREEKAASEEDVDNFFHQPSRQGTSPQYQYCYLDLVI